MLLSTAPWSASSPYHMRCSWRTSPHPPRMQAVRWPIALRVPALPRRAGALLRLLRPRRVLVGAGVGPRRREGVERRRYVTVESERRPPQAAQLLGSNVDLDDPLLR